MTTPHTLGAKDIAREVAREACQRIVDAVYTLPPFLRMNLALALYADESTTLSAIGEHLLGPNPVSAMADDLLAEVFIGDAEQIAPKLGDSEPWATIGAALTDVVTAWRTAHPTYRTAHEFHQRRLRWEEEASAKAATTTIDGEGR